MREGTLILFLCKVACHSLIGVSSEGVLFARSNLTWSPHMIVIEIFIEIVFNSSRHHEIGRELLRRLTSLAHETTSCWIIGRVWALEIVSLLCWGVLRPVHIVYIDRNSLMLIVLFTILTNILLLTRSRVGLIPLIVRAFRFSIWVISILTTIARILYVLL